MRRTWFWMSCALALCGCSGGNGGTPAPTPTPLLIASRGVTMPLTKAVRLIAYRIHPPHAQILAVAVIAPLGGDDTPKTRGVAFEYVTGGKKWLLSEWPTQNFHLSFVAGDASATPCAPVSYSSTAVAWTTPEHLAMTLQPDGAGSIEATTTQARAVVARLGCRPSS